jgi:hypothetical protein
MRVVVQLKPAEALALQRGVPDTPALQGLLETAAAFGAQLRAIHPGAADPLLASFFVADVAGRPVADQFISKLLENEAVAAAYVEPSISPP